MLAHDGGPSFFRQPHDVMGRRTAVGVQRRMGHHPAQIAGGFVDHCWLKTDKREAGLGHLDEGQPAGQAVPGAGCDSPYLAQTQIVDHTSQSQSRSDVKCEEIPDVDEACVDDKLWTDRRGYGTTMGAFSFSNNCQSWVNRVLNECRRETCEE